MATRKPAARKAPAKPRAKPGPKPKVETLSESIERANGTAAPAAPAAQPPGRTVSAGRFKFENGDTVTIAASGEEGMVRARCEWLTGNVSYMIAYTSARGEFHETWIDQDLLA